MWKARVEHDFPMQRVRLLIGEFWDGGGRLVTQIGPGSETTLTKLEGYATTPPLGMTLPEEAAEPLRDALNEFLGKPKDDYRAKYEEARDALQIERDRVNVFLGAVSGLGEQENK